MKEVRVCTDSYEVRDGIILSSAIMEHLQEVSPTALRIYVYFCGCNPDGAITVPISVIGEAVGQSNGTTVKALRELRKLGLISCDSGNGPQANAYRVEFRGSLRATTPERPASYAATGSTPAMTIQATPPLSVGVVPYCQQATVAIPPSPGRSMIGRAHV